MSKGNRIKEAKRNSANVVDLQGRTTQQREDEKSHFERLTRVEKFIEDHGYQVECSIAGAGVAVSVIKLGAALIDEIDVLRKEIDGLRKAAKACESGNCENYAVRLERVSEGSDSQ